MKKLIIITLTIIGFAIAAQLDYNTAVAEDNSFDTTYMTDWACMDDCRDQGYQWGYCQRVCSY